MESLQAVDSLGKRADMHQRVMSFLRQLDVSLPDLEFRRRLAFIVVRVQVLSSHSARNVNRGTAFLEHVGILMGELVLLLMLRPVKIFPVEQVTGVALLTAAKSHHNF